MFEDGSFDLLVFCKLIDWYIVEGIDVLVVVGMSGELVMFNVEEYILMICMVVEYVVKCILIIVGVGGNLIVEVIELMKYVKVVGVDVMLQVVLYYNKLMQEGMYCYFWMIVEVVDLLVILYNVLGWMVVDMVYEMMLCFVDVLGIIGVKEVIGNIDCVVYLIKVVLKYFVIYSGDDLIVIVLMLFGGYGNILVIVNVVLCVMSELCCVVLVGDVQMVCVLYMKLLLLYKNLFIEVNLILVKWVLQVMGKMQGGIWLLFMVFDECCYDVVCLVFVEVGVF